MGRKRTRTVTQKADGSWTAQIEVMVNGVRKYGTYNGPADLTEEQAEAGRLMLLDRIRKRAAMGPAKHPSVTDFAVQWLEDKAGSSKLATGSDYRKKLEWILPIIGHVRADRLTRSVIRYWVKEVEKRPMRRKGHEGKLASDDWLKGCWRTLRNMSRDLAADYNIPDPTLRVKPPVGKRKGERETETLELEEVRQVIDWGFHRAPEWAEEISLFFISGGRGGEVYAFRSLDLDFERGGWDVTRAVSWGDAGVEESGTKTGNRRFTALPPVTLEQLRLRILQLEGHPSENEHGVLLFPASRINKYGTWHRRTGSIYKVLDRCRAELGLTTKLRPQVARRTSGRLWSKFFDRELSKAQHGWLTDEMFEHYSLPASGEMSAAAKRIFGKPGEVDPGLINEEG